MKTEKDIQLQEGLRKRTSNNFTRSESSGSTIDCSITSSDRADDRKFDGNVGKEKATYGITAMVHMKLKESPLCSDAIFKQADLKMVHDIIFYLLELPGVPWITLPLFPFCAFLVEKAAVHTHISEWEEVRQVDESTLSAISFGLDDYMGTTDVSGGHEGVPSSGVDKGKGVAIDDVPIAVRQCRVTCISIQSDSSIVTLSVREGPQESFVSLLTQPTIPEEGSSDVTVGIVGMVPSLPKTYARTLDRGRRPRD